MNRGLALIDAAMRVSGKDLGFLHANDLVMGYKHAFGPHTYLEIGTREGTSLMCALAQEPEMIEEMYRGFHFRVPEEADVEALAGRGYTWSGVRATVCDTWEGEYGGSNRRNGGAHIVKMVGRVLGAAAAPRILSGDSREVIPRIDRGERFDLIFVDGDHSYAGAITDLRNCVPLLAAEGMMLVDDIYHDGHLELSRCACEFAADAGMRLYTVGIYGSAEGGRRDSRRYTRGCAILWR